MPKKRTKKQKARAQEHLKNQYSRAQNEEQPSLVKGEFITKAKKQLAEAKKPKRANLLVESLDIKIIKRDLVKSLIFASLILALTMVIYFAWK
jgi:hypothetical protein